MDIDRNLSIKRANKWPIFSQMSTGHIEGDDSCGFLYCHDRVGEPQWAVITPDSQMDTTGSVPNECSTCHTH